MAKTSQSSNAGVDGPYPSGLSRTHPLVLETSGTREPEHVLVRRVSSRDPELTTETSLVYRPRPGAPPFLRRTSAFVVSQPHCPSREHPSPGPLRRPGESRRSSLTTPTANTVPRPRVGLSRTGRGGTENRDSRREWPPCRFQEEGSLWYRDTPPPRRSPCDTGRHPRLGGVTEGSQEPSSRLYPRQDPK